MKLKIIAFFCLFSVASVFGQNDGATAPSAGAGQGVEQDLKPRQKKLYEAKKKALADRIEQMNVTHLKFKKQYNRFKEYTKDYPAGERYGIYDGNNIYFKEKGTPTYRLIMDFIQTYDRDGFKISFRRELILNFENDKLKSFSVEIHRYRIGTEEMNVKKTITVNTANLDEVTAVKNWDFFKGSFTVKDDDLSYFVRAQMLTKVEKVMSQSIYKLQKVAAAYVEKFNEDSANQEGSFDDIVPVIK